MVPSTRVTLATGLTLDTFCDFVSLQMISFVVVFSSFNKLLRNVLRNVVFSDLLIASEQENNLQGNKVTKSGQSHPS